MGTINTVLAAVDLEAGSDAVLVRAGQLATAHAARLLVLHVIDAEQLSGRADHSRPGKKGLLDRLRRQAIEAIELLLSEGGSTRDTEARVLIGSPHAIIVQLACEQHADIIVIGPGKGSTLKDKLLGSTADKVIRISAAPILVVRKHSAEPYRSVAVAVDGSKPSARAFIEVRRLAPGARMQLVHAVDVPLAFEQAMLRAGTSRLEMEEYRAARANKAREELLAFRRDVLKMPRVPIRLLVGAPGPALVRLSRRGRSDLLALGSRGRGAALQTLLGSVARRVLVEAACDVLIVNVQQ